MDQRVGEGITGFGRYGNLVKGELPFNQAVAVGAQFSGSYWDRGGDAFGIGFSWLQTGNGYKNATYDWNGNALTFVPSGAERQAFVRALLPVHQAMEQRLGPDLIRAIYQATGTSPPAP